MSNNNNGDSSENKCPEKNKSILEQLFNEHAPGLVRFLARKTRNQEDAEDIAQGAFLRIQKLENLDQLDNPRAYLYQTASNLAIDQLRRAKLHRGYLQSETPTAPEIEESSGNYVDQATPERLLSAKEELVQIEETISDLPFKARQAFLLHRTKGLAYSDIAKEMGVSVSSVEKYILLALRQCHQALKH
ncbi:RNA polymerase sigma factor [Pseudoteredinibacter isoporae]|uniref:RNA polymerase sigma-70 factor (ECF subfamily) n=1 Tax=Pseudoteredinibacter isoporae TaxID=570281 RepID=A0A7X0JTY0_9GAMM|nr:RNA polymerase sigma factor [Pseudoteredinibacter isoporae]MBB6521351.1 RNA polymerase sigma-70 factor (ECF subfamily) [Pseudoteredinibacter isoporae]NHO86906.1 RNA polymerase sigma factor [Pseudoteredinibacter isoporae]NIB24642.1 RNA polymerase sigma factor [Pseudoteredinibacter isoporae]